MLARIAMSKKTAFVFFGIIAAGAVISIVTLVGPGKNRPPVPPAEVEVTPVPDPIPEPEPMVVAPPEPVIPPKPELPAGMYADPAAAMSALADAVSGRDFAAFEKAVGSDAIAAPERMPIKQLVENPDWKVDPAQPHVEVSKSAESIRWALNFTPVKTASVTPSSPESRKPIEPKALYVDIVERQPNAFGIAKVSLPLATGTAAAERDALTVAQAFSEAVIRHDYKAARALADPATVTDERVAALMIAIEEGKFTLRPERPFVVTLSRDDITWVLARVESGSSGSSEFAIELGQEDTAWQVRGLTFSKMLSALSDMAGGGGVAYTPIVENPEGGDSLVLYFEFDGIEVNQRTDKQLDIIATILKQSSERVIRITGHADALGTDYYNVSLSGRRAETIRQSLIQKGVKPEQVVTEAFGSAKPRRPNFNPDGTDNPSGRSLNRRAEVYLDF